MHAMQDTGDSSNRVAQTLLTRLKVFSRFICIRVYWTSDTPTPIVKMDQIGFLRLRVTDRFLNTVERPWIIIQHLPFQLLQRHLRWVSRKTMWPLILRTPDDRLTLHTSVLRMRTRVIPRACRDSTINEDRRLFPQDNWTRMSTSP